MARLWVILSLIGLTWLSGCTPSLFAITPPPPTRVARLYSENPVFSRRKHFAQLSAGVALAFNCVKSGPCHNAVATSDDPSIATVVPAHLNELDQEVMSMDTTPPSTFVIVGVNPGETTIRVNTANGNTKIAVTVLE